jgi:hypothetical protein
MAVSSAVRGFLQRQVLKEVWDTLGEEGLLTNFFMNKVGPSLVGAKMPCVN